MLRQNSSEGFRSGLVNVDYQLWLQLCFKAFNRTVIRYRYKSGQRRTGVQGIHVSASFFKAGLRYSPNKLMSSGTAVSDWEIVGFEEMELV